MKKNLILAYMIAFVFITIQCRADNPVINEANLQQQLFLVLSNNYFDLDMSHFVAGEIAVDCLSPSKNYLLASTNDLYGALTNEFAQDAAPWWNTNYTKVSGVAIQVAASYSTVYSTLPLTTNNLQQQLFQAFTNNNLYTLEVCSNELTNVAMYCFSTNSDYSLTNSGNFHDALTNEFSESDELEWENNQLILSNDAKQVAASFFTLAFLQPPFPPNRDQLAHAISDSLTYYLVPKGTAEGEAYKIAQECAGSTNQTDLIQKLNASLNANTNINLTEATRIAVAGKAIGELYPPLQPNPYLLVTDTNGTSRWLVSFSVGAQFLSPFVIGVPGNTPSTGTLSSQGNNTVAYFQFDLMRHWVLAPTFFPGSSAYQGFVWYNRDITPDFDFNVGFLLGNNVNATNTTYSASTLAGSDITMNLEIAEPIWRNSWQQYDKVAIQASLGGSVGMTTEQSFEEIHPNYFAGAIFDVGLPYGFFQGTNTTTVGLVECRIGAGHIQYPSMTGTGSQVILNGDQYPDFHGVWSPEVGANILVPFGNALYLNIEANAFLNNQVPDQWNVKVGVTIPWTTIGNTIDGFGLGR